MRFVSDFSAREFFTSEVCWQLFVLAGFGMKPTQIADIPGPP